MRRRGKSRRLDSGKHTTTHATLYHLDGDSDLIDSPGLQEFGLGHLDRQEIEIAFREFRPYLGQCRFRDCRHDREPGCALRAAVEAGTIDPGALPAITASSETGATAEPKPWA
jgi:ribosome biogenesis GTPase